ncbi:MAG: ABC-F family ATP-binding cassette domain-containing protein [Bacteroidales bacterium]|nr:ABC-F family ATP-binding cassette domain-containing protein [Bacteroidales bacterium]
MFSVRDLAIHYSGNYLFRNVSFIINKKDRIGLVGRNGSGKTTLLRILSGLQLPETGEIVIPSSARLGYLPQEMELSSDKSIYEETIVAFDEILALKNHIEQLSEEIAIREDYESDAYNKLINRLSEANEKFHILGGQSLDADIEKVLTGLGFNPHDFNRPVAEFSYGWQMRIEIAKILLRKPDLILLDEPTNHLDIESIQWLEEFLGNYFGAVVLVSHDRAFLDNLCNRTIEISDERIFDYKAAYTEYIKLREERLEQQLATFNNQQKQIRQVERFIERFRYKNTKSRQVQSKIKMLDKMNVVEIEDFDSSAIHFKFPPAPRSGKVVIETKNLGKRYGSHEVLKDVNISIIKGDRVAFVGRNGEGKTTLSKVIMGMLEFTGEMKFGHNVQLAYYAQDQAEMLDGEKTVFETIDDEATGDMRARVRTLLGGFLFSGEDIDKKVKVLSGGEKSRLSLALLLLNPSNLMILDEPTNHLDMHSKDILKSALLQYDGTLIIVSHDRDFLQGLSNKVFEFRNRNVQEYLSDIYDFLHFKKLKTLRELEQKNASGGASDREVSKNKEIYEKSKQIDRNIRKLNTQIKKSEQKIEKLEIEIAEMDKVLMDPERHRKILADPEVFKKYNDLKNHLGREMERWEMQHDEISILEDQLKLLRPEA